MKTIPCWIFQQTHLAWHIWNSSGVNHDSPHFWETVCAGSLTKEKEIMFQVVDSVTPDNQFFSYFSLHTLSLSNNRLDVCIFYDEDSLCLQQSSLSLIFSQSTLFCILCSDVFMSRSHDVSGHATAKVRLITSCAILLWSAAPADVTSHLAPVNSTKPVHPESPLKLGIVTGYQ